MIVAVESLRVALIACSSLAALCWILSLVTREHSWVDRLWSIAPAGYALWFAGSAGWEEPRLNLMALLAVCWGARLTYNFARKGGYRPGGEDYRWPILRQRMQPALFALFNVVFICAFQQILLLLLALPSWVAWQAGPRPLGPLDAVAAALFLLALAGETVADQQQWNFQQNKAARVRAGASLGPGFLTTGLFRYSRHPNFFCEQVVWWSYYLFCVAAGAPWFNPSTLGPLLLTLLFQGSTSFTESITLSRYPAYAEYRSQTSRLIPWIPRDIGRKG